VFSICGIYYTKAIVEEENIWTVAGDCKFYRDNRVRKGLDQNLYIITYNQLIMTNYGSDS
jgi:hypothetical protein